jgi:CheY-like chemotaxis protein
MSGKMPCSVSKAYDGKESVNLIENSHFDVIFMDVGMPEMSGIEATQKIRSMGIETPIIAVTIGAFETDREECLSAGMNDWSVSAWPGIRSSCSERRMVLRAGLEPAHLTAHAPQACVSTNSTT